MQISFDPVTILTISAVIILLFWLKKFFFKKKEMRKPYAVKGDPQAQKLYDKTIDTQQKYTKSQKEEMSWLFLYEITEKVMHEFSEEDKQAVEDLGRQMLRAGGGYNHVVEYGIKRPKKQSRLIAVDLEKENIKSA